MLEQTEVVGIVRDTQTGALLNTNVPALEAYKKKKAANSVLFELRETNAKLEQRQKQLENDLMEIKTMLQKVLANNV